MVEHNDTTIRDFRGAEGTNSQPRQPGPVLSWLTRHAIDPTPLKVMANFWRQLTLLIEVGVPLLRSLHQIETRTSHPRLRQTIHQIADAIERGSSFSEALSQHPRTFSQLTIQLIQVAERGGVLENSLRLVADEVDRQAEIRSQVKRALAYPIMIALLGLVVTLFVLIFVIPEFAGMFHEQGLPLPFVTRLVLGFANFITHYWWLCLAVVVSQVWIFTLFLSSTRGRLWWDRLTLRMPLFGELFAKAGVLRFAQTMGTLLRGGVPILAALKLVQEHADNRVLALELERVRNTVEQGSRLEEPLRHSTIFPALAVDVIAVGEEAGQLDTVLFKLADAYKEEVDHSASIFSSIIEPLLLCFMGLLVALVVWAVYLPYFSLPKMM